MVGWVYPDAHDLLGGGVAEALGGRDPACAGGDGLGVAAALADSGTGIGATAGPATPAPSGGRSARVAAASSA
jgi:hypothetical protein